MFYCEVSKLSDNMKSIKILIVFITVIGCRNDNFLLDSTPPLFTIPPIPIAQVSSFIPFGQFLTPTQQNPAIEYFGNQSDIPVVSVSEGIVVDVRRNPTIDDFEIWIKPSNNATWLIIYDHVVEVTISKGDQVQTGSLLGTIGLGNRVELQVNDDQNIAHCPLQFGTSSFIQQHMNLYEEWCVEETVTP